MSDDDEEIVEEQPEAQVETVVSEQAEEVHEQTSTTAINRTGEIPGGAYKFELLPSFRTLIAAKIFGCNKFMNNLGEHVLNIYYIH